VSWVSLFSGVVKLINMIAAWLREKELVDTGRDLQQGEQDAADLQAIKDGVAVKSGNNDALDDELCIKPKASNDD
jgi:hypothetical protein